MQRLIIILLLVSFTNLLSKDKLVKKVGDWKLYSSNGDSFMILQDTQSGSFVKKAFSVFIDAVEEKDQEVFIKNFSPPDGKKKDLVAIFSLCSKKANKVYYSLFAVNGKKKAIVCPYVIGPPLITEKFWNKPKKTPTVKVLWLIAVLTKEKKWEYSLYNPDLLKVNSDIFSRMKLKAESLKEAILRNYKPKVKIKPLFDDEDMFDDEENEEDVGGVLDWGRLKQKAMSANGKLRKMNTDQLPNKERIELLLKKSSNIADIAILKDNPTLKGEVNLSTLIKVFSLRNGNGKVLIDNEPVKGIENTFLKPVAAYLIDNLRDADSVSMSQPDILYSKDALFSRPSEQVIALRKALQERFGKSDRAKALVAMNKARKLKSEVLLEGTVTANGKLYPMAYIGTFIDQTHPEGSKFKFTPKLIDFKFFVLEQNESGKWVISDDLHYSDILRELRIYLPTMSIRSRATLDSKLGDMRKERTFAIKVYPLLTKMAYNL